MTIDLTKSVTAGFVQSEAEQQARRGGGGKKREFFQWRNGRHNLRFLVAKHVGNQFDVTRGFISEDLVGKEFQYLAVPVYRVFVGNKPNSRMVNCLPDRRKCPMWQRWFNPKDPTTGEPLSKEAAKQWRVKNSKAQPKPYFLANAIDADHPEQGVHVIAFSRADWLGPRSNTRPPRQIAYGIFNALKGYDPADGAVEGEEGDDSDATLAVGAQVELQPFDGFEKLLADRGIPLFGGNGCDVIIHKSKGNFGLQLDTKKGIAVRDKGECLTFPADEFQPVDILMMPSAYPGYVSGENSQPLSDTTKNFIAFVKGEREANSTPANTAGEAATGVQETLASVAKEAAKPAEAPALPATPVVEQPPLNAAGMEEEEGDNEPAAGDDPMFVRFSKGTLGKSRKRKLAKGLTVMAVDTDDIDDDFPEGVRYFGTVTEYDDGSEVALALRPEDQQPEAAARLAKFIEQGASEFYFPVGQVTILD